MDRDVRRGPFMRMNRFALLVVTTCLGCAGGPEETEEDGSAATGGACADPNVQSVTRAAGELTRLAKNVTEAGKREGTMVFDQLNAAADSIDIITKNFLVKCQMPPPGDMTKLSANFFTMTAGLANLMAQEGSDAAQYAQAFRHLKNLSGTLKGAAGVLKLADSVSKLWSGNASSEDALRAFVDVSRALKDISSAASSYDTRFTTKWLLGKSVPRVTRLVPATRLLKAFTTNPAFVAFTVSVQELEWMADLYGESLTGLTSFLEAQWPRAIDDAFRQRWSEFSQASLAASFDEQIAFYRLYTYRISYSSAADAERLRACITEKYQKATIINAMAYETERIRALQKDANAYYRMLATIAAGNPSYDAREYMDALRPVVDNLYFYGGLCLGIQPR
jgi:hypothetical protein